MKIKILGFLIMSGFLFLLIYSCNQDNQQELINNSSAALGPGDACFPDITPGCLNPTTSTFSINNVPGFPGCTFPVKIKYCVTQTGGLTSIVATDYQLMSHTCNKFIDSLEYFNNTPGESDDLAFISRFDKIMYDKIENQLYGLFAIPNAPSNTVQLTFYRQSCFSVCLIKISPEDKTSIGNDGIIEGTDQNAESRVIKPNSFIKAPCTTQGCCKREVTMCYDPNFGIKKIVQSTPFSLTSSTPIQTCATGVIQPSPLPSYVTIIRCGACNYKCEN